MTARVLVFAEDPGAASYLADVGPALRARGVVPVMAATGTAAAVWSALGVEHDEIPVPASAAYVLDRHAPQALLGGTAEARDALGLALFAAASPRGIATIGAVDGPANVDTRFRGRGGSALAAAPDHIVVPDGATRAAFIALGASPAAVHACGHPRFDALREFVARVALGERALPERPWPAPADRPTLVFAAELSHGLDPAAFRRGADWTLHGTSGDPRRTHVVLEEFLLAIAEMTPRPFLVLRLHPKCDLAEFGDLAARFDVVSQGGAVLPVLWHADLVVGLTSVVLDEALMLGRPALSIVPRAGECDWLLGARAGVTPCVAERSLIRRAVDAALARPFPRAQEAIDEMIPRGAAGRVADVVSAAIGART